MRLLKRNLRKVYYAMYTGKTAVTDTDGNYTGEYELTYSEPVEIYANIAQARNSVFRVQDSVAREMFGNELTYTKTMIINDVNCPINEQTVLYIDVVPAEGVEPDYVVEGIEKSLNYISYSIRKVNR